MKESIPGVKGESPIQENVTCLVLHLAFIWMYIIISSIIIIFFFISSSSRSSSSCEVVEEAAVEVEN